MSTRDDIEGDLDAPGNGIDGNIVESTDDGQLKHNKICRDFIKGGCRRKFCRYPHVLSPELVVFCHDYQNQSCNRVSCKFLHYSIQEEEYYRRFGEFPVTTCDDDSPPIHCIYAGSRRGRMFRPLPIHEGTAKRPPDDLPPHRFKRFRDDDTPDVFAALRRFEEDAAMMRRRIEANEMKIAELRASNEFLLAQMRLTTQCSRVVNPVTNTTSTQPPGQTAQVLSGVSMAPVQVQATPIVSMAAPQTQIIASSGPPIIAANTSQGQQLAIAAAQQTLSTSAPPLGPPHAPQLLSTSQITLAPALPAPSMGLTINTSQALAMSNATQPIISYPVMTHSILPH
ncbi:zinc finger CCCH domain-containing protein 10-like isoform X2 [Phlebotomus papatasi]|uniref:zinc finger CCCH domain-containing protein 10-like isoform X2 n=1 Tax=Phlebotomus papatasi TaxID=29031 RepID=UPI00248432D1|nr:zinc finger CCCH domain-containing protein 10-like isoform X2 [Phlebotomus papatasi]